MPETIVSASKEEHRFYPYSGIFFVTRRSFWQAGQDSFTQPPAQNPDMFSKLTNVEPVLQGVLRRRRGYTLFSPQSPTQPYSLGYSFRSELLGLRSVVFTSTRNVLATTEAGAAYLNPVFVPSAGAVVPRMALSRSYGYFADGVAADNKKWDGTQGVTSLTNWGISLNTSISGPNTTTVAADQGSSGSGGSATQPVGTGTDLGGGNNAWVNPNNISTGGSTTSSLRSPDHGNPLSNTIGATNFGFSIPSTATIQGVVVSVSKAGGTFIQDNGVNLTVASVDHSSTSGWVGTTNYGGSSDLWGATLTPAIVNASTFGVRLAAQNTDVDILDSGGGVIRVGRTHTATIFGPVTITVYYSTPVGFSWTNPNNITTCVSAVATSSVSTSATSDLRGTGFGFAVSGSITGILVTIKADTSNASVPINVNPILVKAGATTGLRKTSPTSSTTLGALTFGGQFDLWGGNWTAADINNANFGVQFNCTTTSNTAVVGVNCVRITVYIQAGPITVGTPTGTGSITLLSGRTYFYVFQNSRTGTTSTLSPASLSTGPVTSVATIPLSNIPVPNDIQADTVLILATADGNDQTTLFLVGSVLSGTTTFNDTLSDAVLLTQPLYQNTDAFGSLHGVANNNPPPSLIFPTKHKGRIYGSAGNTLFFSKNLDEVTTANGLTTSKWEEAWPATNSLDISETAETIKGLLSDGETLWIGTERAIRRLIGDSPQNFQKPEIQFNETGIFNQDVWKIVFYEGQPVGTMWLTPDLRVISSDFNTYQDVGWPIQDVLNSVNVGATFGPQASFVSKGSSDYFMLYLPTGANTAPDTICVYNLRNQKWFIWQPTDQGVGSLFFIDAVGNPRWLFSAQAGQIFEWLEGSGQDRIGTVPVSYTVTVRTSWLDFGDSNLRKALNQILYLGLASPTITIEGAITDSHLDTTPQVVLPATSTSVGPLQDLFVPLAGTASQHRWYRLTFAAQSSDAVDVLDGFSIEATGLFRY